jgi:serine/threonine protein kinase/WD40 repeat protein
MVSLPLTEKPGDRIGPYKLLEQIGEGGCGVVFAAQQEQPVRRRVALKVIKVGMDTRQVVARFEAERQALALMDHPNIAKVFEAGATETGRPYFVMELVKGIPITRYCDENKLATKERLTLFIQVCQAIQHAHQKGIIHRDIKPSNILVADHDGVPVPKVIDFGIAKATTDQPLTDKTLYTAIEQFIGTPAYMSPEQAKLSGLDIDTRSDIYSLGVLLYELLTGRTPFDPKRLIEGGLDEIRRIIREEDPPRPSTRLSTLDAAEQTAVAARRQSEPPKLRGLIRGDLDWIVMKTLEKDRNRRYETANGLASDLQRHLKNEPVVARPPSKLYRFQKLAQRNRAVFLAGVAVVASVAIGIFALTWLFLREKQSSELEAHLRANAELAQAKAASEREAAMQRLYGSLVREARSIRLARRTGYRNEVFSLLRQANALSVPQKRLSELRREAVACLGDFAGFAPTALSDLPLGTTIKQTIIAPANPHAVAFAPGNHAVAFLLSDGTILIRKLPSGETTGRLRAEHPARSFCFSAKGDRLISVHRPNTPSGRGAPDSATICNWQRDEQGHWTKVDAFPAPGAFECLASDEGPLLAVNDANAGSLELHDLRTLTVNFRIPHAPGVTPSSLALTPDAHFLAVAWHSGPQEVEIWDVRSGKLLQQFNPRLDDWIYGVALTSDGKYFAYSSLSGCSVYKTLGAEHVATKREFVDVFSGLSFAARSTMLALPLRLQNRVLLWDGVRDKDLGFLESPRNVVQTTLSPDGRVLLASGGREVWMFRLDARPESASLTGHAGGVAGVCFSPDGLRLASVCKDRMVRVWDATEYRILWEGGPLRAEGQGVSYSPDGRYLATTTWGWRSIWIWDAQTGKRLLDVKLSEPSGIVWSAQFSPDSRFLAAASNYGLNVWSLDLATRDGPTSTPVGFQRRDSWSLAFSADAEQLVFLQPDSDGSGSLFLWKFTGAAAPRLLATGVTCGPQTFSLSPDRNQLVTIERGKAVIHMDTVTGTKLSSFPILRFEAVEPNLCLSPDGSRVAMATASRRGVDVWNPVNGQLLYSLPEQDGTTCWFAWSPDSRRLAVSRSDGDVSIWNLAEIDNILAKAGLNELRIGNGGDSRTRLEPDAVPGAEEAEARRPDKAGVLGSDQ